MLQNENNNLEIFVQRVHRFNKNIHTKYRLEKCVKAILKSANTRNNNNITPNNVNEIK